LSLPPDKIFVNLQSQVDHLVALTDSLAEMMHKTKRQGRKNGLIITYKALSGFSGFADDVKKKKSALKLGL
jgi:hypothetical protein